MIGYNRPSISLKDINAVKEVLKNQWITQGKKVELFENSLKIKFGSKYCSVLSSGTAALHLTAVALDLKKGDLVLTSPNTFIASANCAEYLGARIDLIDIDKKNFTIDIDNLEKKLKKYKKNNIKIKAVIAIDYAGQPCDWINLKKLSLKYKFKLVNDNCHSLGSKYYGSIKYAVKYADVVTQSFHAVKNFTTGEGGAVLTNSKKIYTKIKRLKNHGIDKNQKIKNTVFPWYYNVDELGYNYRLTDFQSALGLSQLDNLNNMIIKRRKIAQFYNHKLKNTQNIIIPKVDKYKYHSYHLYPLQILFENLKKNKLSFFNYFKKNKILLQVHYVPIYNFSYYQKKYRFNKNDFPNCEKFYKNVFSITLYPNLKIKDQMRIVNLIKSFIKQNSK